MAISEFFGLPGAGKTTILTKRAIEAVKSKRYKHVYTNVRLKVPGTTYIDNECIGKYMLRDCKLLIDEGMLFAHSRGYKDFQKSMVQFFVLHRHYRCDIDIFLQQADGLDKIIRVITDRVYYVGKGKILGIWWSYYYRIPYGIIIPDPKKDGNDRLGEILQGYCKPPFLARLFCKRVFRPRYYRYFDSFECPPLPSLPLRYEPVPKPRKRSLKDLFSRTCKKTE